MIGSMSKAPRFDESVHMRRALMLAARGVGRVEPNPMVGCVLVRRGRVVGEGYHRRFGGPHAEVEAIRAAGKAVRGATAYVTLEPCCHHGKTPPCTDALLAAGIDRVVAAMADPFPRVCGRGLDILRKAGVQVDIGLCEHEAIQLNGPYLKRQKLGLPWVILKWAQTIDGKIATRTGESRWISGEQSRKWVHQVRGRVDAIIVGVGTAIADDPLLDCRYGRRRRVAARVVIDPHLRTPSNAQLVRTARQIPTILVSSHGVSGKKAAVFEQAGAEVMSVRETRGGLDLRAMLKQLARRGMTNVLVEGGGKTLGSFYDQGLADEAIVFISRRLMGGELATSPLAGRGPARMKDVTQPVWSRLTGIGEDDVYRLGLTDPRSIVQ
jgi:diaminohydroxyphosphoribosylaminopyrimidine deaminase/5-amino-6-(5-phosphoribosylamino)uracil reductase